MSSAARIPHRFDKTATAAAIRQKHEALEDGAETDDVVSIAGRTMLVRDQGRLAFATLDDTSDRIQLFAGKAWTEDFEGFQKLSRGDWVGVTGPVVKTKKGELSIKVTSWQLLAEARISFPDKWHGLTDPDTRYRQRYVDLWVSDDSRRALVMRSRMVSLIRRFLDARGFLEVETPTFHPIPGGATAKPFTTHHNALDADFYLRIATELYLKRCVVGGFERVYEIGRTFRNEGISPRHLPEFTMIEVYQAYADYTDMAELTETLVAHLATELCGTTKLTYGGRELDLTPPWRRASLIELVEEQIGVRLDLRQDIDELRAIAREHGVPKVDDAWGPGKLILEIYEKTTESQLWGPVFVLDYPKEVSPLARDHRELPGMAERFEPIVAGRELGNAFTELIDPDEQRLRFEEQARQKAYGDDEAMVIDQDFLRALEYGMPPLGGLGIGIDRLAMLLTGAENIKDVVIFPTLRPEVWD